MLGTVEGTRKRDRTRWMDETKDSTGKIGRKDRLQISVVYYLPELYNDNDNDNIRQ